MDGLNQSAVSGLLRFITAGSVDDGKSTLIGRLLFDSKTLHEDQLSAIEASSRKRGMQSVDLSLLTDGLSAEREQGITIDVAYRYFSTPSRKFIVGDSPGHIQYTRNMVTAASTADVAVILVDAESGVKTQTRRHLYLAHWVGVSRVVFAVNKMDTIGHDQTAFELIRDSLIDLARGIGYEAVDVIPVSALHGDNVVNRGDNMPWYLGSTLLEYLEQVPGAHDSSNQIFRFSVQRVLRVAEVRHGWIIPDVIAHLVCPSVWRPLKAVVKVAQLGAMVTQQFHAMLLVPLNPHVAKRWDSQPAHVHECLGLAETSKHCMLKQTVADGELLRTNQTLLTHPA